MTTPNITLSERVCLARLAASPLGWIEVHNRPGERRVYLAAIGLIARNIVVGERTRDNVIHLTK